MSTKFTIISKSKQFVLCHYFYSVISRCTFYKKFCKHWFYIIFLNIFLILRHNSIKDLKEIVFNFLNESFIINFFILFFLIVFNEFLINDFINSYTPTKHHIKFFTLRFLLNSLIFLMTFKYIVKDTYTYKVVEDLNTLIRSTLLY